jgi:hypothetical protein
MEIFQTSTPLRATDTDLEIENRFLKQQMSVLQEQWSAAVDRSIMMDKRFMDMKENKLDIGTQTINHSSVSSSCSFYEGARVSYIINGLPILI